MELLVSNTFGSWFYFVNACIVFFIIWKGYSKNIFLCRAARTVSITLVIYTVVFLGYRFGTGYTTAKIAEHTQSDAQYVLWAALHGITSLIAILLTCFVLERAKKSFRKGENYFRIHKQLSILLVLVWLLAFFFGFLV